MSIKQFCLKATPVALFCGLNAFSVTANAACPSPWGPIGAGPKTNGPNRVTLSGKMFGGAKGTFSRTASNSMKLNLNHSNEHRNRPTFYLGAKGSEFELDAGAYYEPLTIGTSAPGWVGLVRPSVYSCSRWIDAGAERVQNVSNVETEVVVQRNGKVTLTMTGFEGLEANLWQIKKAPMDVANMRMKRVIGLTQQRGTSVDGSYFLHTQFRDGALRKWKQDPKTKQWELEAYGDHWLESGSETINKPRTAHATGVNYIDCDPPWQRLGPNGNDQSPTAHSPALPNSYTRETVNIDLRGKKIDKKALKPGKRT